MNKIQLSQNKTLKLTNVLKYNVDLSDEEFQLDTQIEKMQSYIRAKGTTQIGPLIQYTKPYINEEGELEMELVFMLQCNSFIHSVEAPYSMEAVLRIPDCMYVRYIGPEASLKFAYDKINLAGFEENIPLAKDSYTIFVDRNDDEETIVADVFVPKAKEE